MKKINVAINGFGRIGRAVLKAGINKENLNFVAINDLTEPKTLAYLLKYDSVYRQNKSKISADKNSISVDGKKIMIYAEKEPAKLPWKDLKIDVVVESTGFFTNREDAAKHLEAGAKKVVISAPAKEPDATIVLGVNENIYDKKNHRIISMASCTTNCLAPIVKVLNEKFGIEKGFMTTAHAYTNDQNILDVPHKNLRRGRAAALSIVPTTSGATKSVADVIPELKGKLDGLSLRVPVANGSIVDFVAKLRKKTTVAEINETLKKESQGSLDGILEYTEDELVSMDVVGNPHSSIVDGLSTQMIGDDFVKVLSWYDNEWGYSTRLVELLEFLFK